jgi:arylsulfatase A-like enzyme
MIHQQFKTTKIFIFILLILSLICQTLFCFAKDSQELAGKYRGYNVILIILDSLRPDHLSCYGYPKKTSPNLDALAEHSAIFTNAFSQSVLTLPCVTSIFTSLYPFSHQMVYVLKDKLAPRIYTLAQVLGIYGYKTVWWGDINDPHSGAVEGLLNGFTEKYELFPEKNPIDLKEYGKVFSWIRKNVGSPFFITVHSYQTHEEFFPRCRFDNAFSRTVSPKLLASLDELGPNCKGWSQISRKKNADDCPVLDEKQQERLNYSEWRKTLFSLFYSLDKKEISDLLSLLDSSIYEFDRNNLADLVNELKKQGFDRKTIIIITADHGNEYKEHGHIGHTYYLYDESVRIPLIVVLPDSNRKREIKELVQEIDILPTVLDLLAIPIPRQAQGISLVGLMEGKPGALTNEYVFAQTVTGMCSIRSKKWKLVKRLYWINPELQSQYLKNKDQGGYRTEEQLFYLVNDKRERNELGSKRKKIAEELSGRLESKLRSLIRYKENKDEFDQGIDEQTKERIRKTGYW